MKTLDEAVAGVMATAGNLDAGGGSIHALHQALDELHAAARVNGGSSPMWNALAGVVREHVDAVLATVPAKAA